MTEKRAVWPSSMSTIAMSLPENDFTGRTRERLLGGHGIWDKRERKAEKKRRKSVGEKDSAHREQLRNCYCWNRDFARWEGGRKRRAGGLVCSREAMRMFCESGWLYAWARAVPCRAGPSRVRTMQTTIRNQVVDGWRSHYRAIVGRVSPTTFWNYRAAPECRIILGCMPRAR